MGERNMSTKLKSQLYFVPITKNSLTLIDPDHSVSIARTSINPKQNQHRICIPGNRLRKSNRAERHCVKHLLDTQIKNRFSPPSSEGEEASTPQHLLFQTYHSHAKQTPSDPSKSFLSVPRLPNTNRVCKYRGLRKWGHWSIGFAKNLN